jgi:hypothetical protein
MKKRSYCFPFLSAAYFLLPNGDVYLLEPYARQQNLTVNNLGFRDYFKGVIASHNTYLGGVIQSASIHRPTADIAIPIYSYVKGAQVLSGVWDGTLEFKVLNKSLQEPNLTRINERVVYLDQHVKKIADSNQQHISNTTESFPNLHSFKEATQGKSGSLVESFNNTKMFIAYQPVKLASTTWVVLLMDPYSDLTSSFMK